MKLHPIVKAVGIEALAVIGGAIVAAALLRQVPSLRAWIKESWQ